MSASAAAPARAAVSRLAREIADAHGWPDPPLIEHPFDSDGVNEDGGEVVVLHDGADAQKLKAVLAAHDPDARAAGVPPLTDDEITALRSMLTTR